MLKATVSGSFHRHMMAIYDAVGTLKAEGVVVLSPADPTVVDHIGEFLFVASDRLRSIKLVQDRHLEAIRGSDFLWVVCPDGYTGPSTSGEIMAAHVLGVPVFSTGHPLDITLGQYVSRVSSVKEAISSVRGRARPEPRHILLDPERSINGVLDVIGDLSPALVGSVGNGASDAERAFARARLAVAETFGLKN